MFIQSAYYIQNITLKDLTGKIVLQKNIESQSSATLDISALPNGLYFIQVQTNEGSYTEKLVVQH